MSPLSPLGLLSFLIACTAPSDKDGGSSSDTSGEIDNALDGDGDGFIGEDDCNDLDSSVNPGVPEICDGIDNNCDGQIDEDLALTWYEDSDGDGFGDPSSTVEACSSPTGAVSNGTDCDDSSDQTFPGAPEACDGRDNDCDGSVDEGEGGIWYTDSDGDGYGDPDGAVSSCDGAGGLVDNAEDCDDEDSLVSPEAEEICDEVDNNCDGDVDEHVGLTWYEDRDGDGYGVTDNTVEACSEPAGYAWDPGDCDDSDASFHPGADESDCTDPNDYNCDGSVAYADADGDGWAACTECDDRDDAVFPGADEVCNGIDDDCDGDTDDDDSDLNLSTTTTWYEDDDSDGYGDAGDATRTCTMPTGFVANDDDCNDANAAVSPAGIEVCNDYDDDCDGLVDDLDSSLGGGTSTFYDDDDSDGYGDPTDTTQACDMPAGYVSNDDDCNDTNPAISPADAEICNDLDDDCDGLIDDDDGSLLVTSTSTFYDDDDGDGYGDPADRARACDAPAGFVTNDDDCDDTSASISPAAAEICNDLDDDCDGRIDDADSGVTGESTWYDDDDGDSYGDPLVHLDSCDAPAGWVGNDDDCDDSDATVYPGSSESWFDGVDSDCDGLEDPHPCDSLPGATTVSTASCTVSRSGTWSVSTEWSTDPADGYSYSVGPSYTHVMAAPVVGQTNDDTGDGIIDGHDTPDIIYSTFAGSSYSGYGYLRVVNGDDGSIRYSVSSVVYSATTHYVAGASSVAIGDLENDGEPEILVSSYGSRIIALNAEDGTVKWVSSASCGSARCAPAIGDLDGDGEAEVVAGTAILSASGTSIGTLPYDGDNRVTLADMNDDGDMEIFTGNGAYDDTGAQIWRFSTATGNSAVGNFDSDSNIEVVFEYAGYIYLINHTGSQVWRTRLSGSTNAAPCVADFDGDGLAEVAAVSSTRITMLDSDGTVDWYYSTDDSSSYSSSCSAFDFDGDGDFELVYADESIFYIFNGATGALLYSTSSHASGTIWEYPVVADVDNDGQAEVVLVSNDYRFSGWDGIHVLGEANGRWASARQSFNQYAYIPDHINEDMTIPEAPGAVWADWGTRSQAPYGVEASGAADLQAYVLGVCETCRSSGYLDVYVSVENRGDVLAPAATSVALYGLSGSTTTLIAVDEVGIPVLPGERSAPLTFTIHESSIGSSGLRAVADDDGTGAGIVTECDEADNSDDWNSFECL